jgi:hypothetical protein
MPNPVLVGARLRRAPVLMLAALASALLASPAAATRSDAAADGGDPEDTVVLPDDPVEADLGGALGSLDARIDAERAEANAAAKSLADARGRLEAADAALAEAEHRGDALVPDDGALASRTFASRGSENIGSWASPPVPKPALALPLTVDAATVERLVQARALLAAEAEKRSLAELEATEQARRAEAAQLEAEAAAARKAEFLEEAHQRLTEELDEATIVGDTERQAEVEARRDELVTMVAASKRAAAARKAKTEVDAEPRATAEAEATARLKAEAAAAALKPRPIGRLTGRYPAVQCPGGGSITIDGSLAHNLNAMLRTAWGDGVNLCGGGYRDPKQQIRLRIQNCGSSSYAIYRMPSGSCSPPTAIPGTSMHERGLAIDFRCAGHGIPSRSGPCFGWMAGHAAAFGFFNLPSEPWHWSIDGT